MNDQGWCSTMRPKITIVADENCPNGCTPEEFHNRPKVSTDSRTWWWKCYNPDCEVTYYNPTTRLWDDEGGRTWRYSNLKRN